MTRTISSDAFTALTQPVIRMAQLVKLQFTVDYTLYLWSGFGDVIWDGNLYLGNGWLKPVQGIDESSELKATGCEIVISGVGSDIVSLVLAYTSQLSRGSVYLAMIGDDGAIIDDPIPLFAGNLDVPEIIDSPEASTISLKYESDFIALSRTPEFRYTDASQRALYPDDVGFKYMFALQDWKGYWGKQKEKKTKKEAQHPKKNKH